MKKLEQHEKHRRAFLKYLAASPVLSTVAKSALAATEGTDLALLQRTADPWVWNPHDPTFLIDKPEDALDVFEFEPVAHKNVPPAHWGFMSTGADSDGSYIANRQDISKFAIRSRRLRDVQKVDPSRQIFGTKYAMPYFLCPIGSQAMYHPDAEMAAARASGRHGVAQALSTVADTSTTDAGKGRNSPVWFQLYQNPNWDITKAIVARAERDGCPAVLVTVDGTSARKDMQFERSKRRDSRLCATCHETRPNAPKSPLVVNKVRPQFSEIPADMWTQKFTPDALTWEFLKRLRDFTKMQIFVKGVMDVEDAALCVKYGYGVYVSNHGGRNEDTSGSTIASLADIAPAVKGKVPIFIDGGFRRGMDIVKAVAMGATMVGVGRPYIWGLGAFGEAGVDKVIQILNAEVIAAMQQVGAASLKDLHPGMIHRTL